MMRRYRRIAFVSCLIFWSAAIGSRGEESEPCTEIHFGYDQNEGNSDTIGIRIGAKHTRTRADKEWASEAVYAYGESDGTRNVNRGRASSDYDWRFGERLYVNTKIEALFDDPAQVDYRVIVGPPSLGYYFIKSEKRTLSGELGLAYMWEEVDGIPNDAPLLRAKQEFEQHFGEDARFWQSLEYLPQLDEFDRYLLNAVAGVESGLTEMLFLRFVVSDRYDSQPGKGLKKNDLRMNASLAIKF
jgi:putative salt-induced outer membrane protein YdiY